MNLYQVKGTPDAQVEVIGETPCGKVRVRTFLNNEILDITKEAFEIGFEPIKEQLLKFGQAIESLKDGKKVARNGWNGKGMYIQLNKARDFEFSELCPFLTIKNVRNSFDTWVPSISDLLAEDWVVV